MDYNAFLEQKRQLGGNHGFEPTFLPEFLFPFQRALVEWACRKGRAAIFADCGLGKGPMALVWSENVVRKTNKPVLIATPLAVSYQLVREGEKFHVEARRSLGERVSRASVIVTNYQRLDRFDPGDFSGMVCDESSILKNFDGSTRAIVTEFMRKLPYRLLCTATAAPNDYVELGTSSEALGELGHMDMLGRFFKNENNTTQDQRRYGSALKWRFKGHAEEHFWRWVCSWARAVRRPSDLGFADDRFVLPPMDQNEHVVKARNKRDGFLFSLSAQNFHEEREERRRTIDERCERVAELANHDDQVLVWCHLNDEGDRLASMIHGAVQVKGSDSDDAKEESLLAFAEGQTRALITKPKIGAWGLNLQRCAHVTFFPSHSYEQFYQGVRRCWRFGQQRRVKVDVVASEGEVGVLANLQRKADQANRMFSALVQHMNDAQKIERSIYDRPTTEVPAWMMS